MAFPDSQTVKKPANSEQLRSSVLQQDGMHLFKTSINLHLFLFLGLGALFVCYACDFLWRIMKTLLNGDWSPLNTILNMHRQK